ncbi:hypothetical protein CYLTODRAFT_458388 [Cylindrobasidium torrendii FP15055 ss-10]|uniref:F-box domain-containing protein n=1 Tax=Cylindrobasidium torrendii FP15055 ss-10 TaxID=1314674 RepID=A0A0D7AY18_9AGAR|nr:hypothetical protein CYLTODRAFT_458388 [Cylindrobasidium torrendii FP15055 ss-10]
MASIATLPLELLQHIFYYACVSTTNEDAHVYRMAVKRDYPELPFQHVLLQVCHQWHNAAGAALRLWSSIRIQWFRKSLVDVKRIQQIVQGVIQRTGTAPLDIALPGDAWDAVARCFIPESTRWKILSVSNAYSSLQISQYRALQDKLPALETLIFFPRQPTDCTPEIWKEYANAVSLMLSNAPCLRRVSGHLDLLSLSFPWKQIEEVIVHLGPNAKPRDRFHWSEDLKNCTSVRDLMIFGEPPKYNTDIRMPSVQYLRCMSFSERWLACLTLPALRRLLVHGIALPNLPGLVARSGCQLNALAINIPPALDDSTVSNFRAILPYLPRLESLKLYYYLPLAETRSPLRVVPRLAELLDPVANANALPLLAEFCLSLVHTSGADAHLSGVEGDGETEIMLRTALAVTESILRPTMRFASIDLENISKIMGSMDEQVVLGLAEFVKLQARARSEGVLTRVRLVVKLAENGNRVLMDSYLK